jgi:hypothetical protein
MQRETITGNIFYERIMHMITSHDRSMKIFSIVIKMLSIRKISQNVLPSLIGIGRLF